MNRNCDMERLFESMTIQMKDGSRLWVDTSCPVCEDVMIYIQDDGKVLCSDCDSMFWPWHARLDEGGLLTK